MVCIKTLRAEGGKQCAVFVNFACATEEWQSG